MRNRMAALCVVVGFLAGYLLPGSSMKAQSTGATARPAFVTPGAELTLQFEQGASNVSYTSCAVRAVDGAWVECATTTGIGVDRPLKWVNLTYVVQISQREK